MHGLKHQTVDDAFGITVALCGPTSLRRNDLALLRKSDINNKVKVLCAKYDIRRYIFGDSAYKRDSNLMSYIKQETMPEDFDNWNHAMKAVRISIEWNYGYTAALFQYVKKKDKLKLLKSHKCHKVYTVANLFKNFHVMYNGGQSSQYFGVKFHPDHVYHYITQTDLPEY